MLAAHFYAPHVEKTEGLVGHWIVLALVLSTILLLDENIVQALTEPLGLPPSSMSCKISNCWGQSVSPVRYGR